MAAAELARRIGLPLGHQVEVWLNGHSLGVFQPTGRVVVFGQAGNDDIEVAGSIATKALLQGDAGNDRLSAGSGRDRFARPGCAC